MNPRFFLLLSLLLALPVVHAVGFSNLPSQREFLFEPDGELVIPLVVSNGQHIKATVSTLVPSDPSTLGTPQDDNILEYVTLEDPAPDTGGREVILRFDFPKQLKPGTYEIYVIAAEYPGGPSAPVSAIAMARVRFIIRVLTDEPLAEVTGLSFKPIAEGMPTNVSVAVSSRTLQDISRAQAEVFVYKDGAVIASARSPPSPLPSAETAVLEALVPTEELRGGEYQLNATVAYDGGRMAYSWTDILKVGTLHVGLPSHTPTLTYNVTNRFTFNISNEWSRELQEVYAVTTIHGQAKKTASQNIPPFGQTEYEVYFDRDETLAPGPIEGNITITFKDYDPQSKQYVNKQESFSVPLQVVMPPEPPKKELNMTLILTGGIIFLLIVLLIVAIILLMRRPKQAAQPARPTPQQATNPAQQAPSSNPSAQAPEVTRPPEVPR